MVYRHKRPTRYPWLLVALYVAAVRVFLRLNKDIAHIPVEVEHTQVEYRYFMNLVLRKHTVWKVFDWTFVLNEFLQSADFKVSGIQGLQSTLWVIFVISKLIVFGKESFRDLVHILTWGVILRRKNLSRDLSDDCFRHTWEAFRIQ